MILKRFSRIIGEIHFPLTFKMDKLIDLNCYEFLKYFVIYRVISENDYLKTLTVAKGRIFTLELLKILA